MADSIRRCPTNDPDSPYYLNSEEHSEYDSLRLMVILSKAEDNYIDWKLRLQVFLRNTDKLGFIDGTISKPDPSSSLYKPWERCDEKVKYWFITSMKDDVLKLVMHAKTAQQMWEDIRHVFVPNLDLKVYQLRRSLATMRQGGDSVKKYFDKLNRAWIELSEYNPPPKCACGGCQCDIKKQADEARDKEERYAFLMGLNKDLSYVRAQIMLMDPPPSALQAYLMVRRAEA